jgi:hypothetical protein
MKKYEERTGKFERIGDEGEICVDDVFYERIISLELKKYKEVIA